MIEKCVNPACSTRFRYLHEGKLFVLEAGEDAGPVAPSSGGSRRPRRLRLFWMCEPCSRTMTIIIEKGREIRLAPLSATAGDTAAAS